jgi:hypothetical protein
MNMNDGLERMRKEAIMANITIYPVVSLEVLEKKTAPNTALRF